MKIRKKPTVSAFNALGVPNSERITRLPMYTEEELAAAKKVADAWNRSNMPTDTMAPTIHTKG